MLKSHIANKKVALQKKLEMRLVSPNIHLL